MNYKHTPISRMSDRGRLRKAMGELHLEILRLRRGNRCEICGLPGNVGRFHILEVSTHPRLEFVDDNVLLAHWLNNCQAHYLWHHFGPHDNRNIRTLNRIIALRGENWNEKLLERERYVGKMSGVYLLALHESLKKELEALRGIKSASAQKGR